MKKIITLFAASLFSALAFAQITLPYTQGFENVTFVTGGGTGLPSVEFLPGWSGNQVQPTPTTYRIHRDTIYPRTGRACLAALPTSTVKDTIILTMNVPANNSVSMSFFGASDSARTAAGNRPAKVNYDYSFDGGATFINKTAVGDTAGFPRRPTPYIEYTINTPANLTPTVPYSLKIRFVVTRGYGLGTAARFLMDDINIVAIPVLATERDRLNTTNLVVFPNPANETVSFRLSDRAVRNAVLTVSDLTGRTVYSQNNLNIEVNELVSLPKAFEAGHYTLILRSAENVYTQRFSVVK